MMEAVARDNYKYDYDYRAVKFSEYVDSIRQGIWLPNSERDKYFGLFCQSCEPPGIYRYTNGLEMVTRWTSRRTWAWSASGCPRAGHWHSSTEVRLHFRVSEFPTGCQRCQGQL